MKDTFAILRRYHGKEAIRQRALKAEIEALQTLLKKHGQTFPIHHDIDLLQASALGHALRQKERLDETLLRSLAEMEGYWDTLQYADINRLLQVDLQPLFSSMQHFRWQQESVYLPCLDETLNHRYHDEPGLFRYPQYRAVLWQDASFIKWGHYGTLPYEHGFGLFQCLAKEEGKSRLVLYLEAGAMLYVWEEGVFTQTLSLGREHDAAFDREWLDRIALALLHQEEKELLRCLLAFPWKKESLRKKLQKRFALL